MNAVKLNEIFKGNKLEEMKYWLDNESPYYEDSKWKESPDGSHMVKQCNELNMYHNSLIDVARETFAIHDLLPTFATLSWYEDRKTNSHHDTGPVEHTILYNYFSENELVLEYQGQEIVVQNEEAIAYNGQEFEHYVKNNTGLSLCLYFNFARPDNYHFVLGQHTKQGYQFPSGRSESEVIKDWL